LILLTLVFARTSYFFYQQASDLRSSDIEISQGEIDGLLAQLSRIMVLPDEEPTIATVSDTSVLQGQPFFQHAEKGDRVFIFSESGKAVLYREKDKKIVEIAPINIGSPLQAQ